MMNGLKVCFQFQLAPLHNGEDLEGFAGAGLYDSIQMNEAGACTSSLSAQLELSLCPT